MTEAAVKAVVGSGYRTGKSPQGFDTIACHTSDYSEYLLIYFQSGKVVGICGIGKSMSFGGVSAGQNGNNLSGWTNISGYKTSSGKAAAKKKAVSATEQAYAFYDALGDNCVYCIQVFNPAQVKDKENDMIYMTDNLEYSSAVTASIATEIGHMLNAFRVYQSKSAFTLHSGLEQCAQTYCNNASSSKLASRNPDVLLDAMGDAVYPCYWGEACYTDAADAISFANSLIEMDDFYQVLVNTSVVDGDTVTWGAAGVGMASKGSHTYVTVDYVDEP